MAKSFFEKLAKSLLTTGANRALKKLFDRSLPPKAKTATKKSKPTPEQHEQKIHPWRACGIGKHWVSTHPLTVPESKKGPSRKTIRRGHCADNPTGKKDAVVLDYMDKDEVDLIAENEFSNLKNLPRLGSLPEFAGSEQYDPFIQGWTKYWNEVLKPAVPLDPNIIKALIASESSFNLKPKPQHAGKAGIARGFIQLTDQAISALSDPRGELKNHYVKIKAEETENANMSICAGTRWIFQKQKLASRDLKRVATWIEAVEKYKGVLNKSDDKKKKELHQFHAKFQILKK